MRDESSTFDLLPRVCSFAFTLASIAIAARPSPHMPRTHLATCMHGEEEREQACPLVFNFAKKDQYHLRDSMNTNIRMQVLYDLNFDMIWLIGDQIFIMLAFLLVKYDNRFWTEGVLCCVDHASRRVNEGHVMAGPYYPLQLVLSPCKHMWLWIHHVHSIILKSAQAHAALPNAILNS